MIAKIKALCFFVLTVVFASNGNNLDAQNSTLPEPILVVLNKAIEAHGGYTKLSTHRADRVKMKGAIQFAGVDATFKGETTVQLPDQMKTIQEITVKGKSFNVIQVLDKDKVLVNLNGQPQKAEEPVAIQIKETMRLAKIIRLVPLLTGKEFEVTDLGLIKAGELNLHGIKVKEVSKPDILLFFDRQTGFLVKTEQIREFENKKVIQEDYFSDFRDLGGFKRPVKIQSFRNGKKILDAELVEVRYFENLPSSDFKP